METNIILSVAEAKRIIDNYFGDATHSVEIHLLGEVLDVEITYEDFRCKRRVRKDIETLLPNADVSRMERMYSTPKYLQALYDVMESNDTIYVKDASGALHPTSLMVLLDGRLYGKDFE